MVEVSTPKHVRRFFLVWFMYWMHVVFSIVLVALAVLLASREKKNFTELQKLEDPMAGLVEKSQHLGKSDIVSGAF